MALIYTYGVGPTGYTDGTTTSGWQAQNFPYGGSITIAEAGTIDQLGAYLSNTDFANPFSVKFALFDSASNLVSAFGETEMSAGQAMGWVDSPVIGSPVAVTAGTYYVMTIAESEFIFQGYDTANAGSFGNNVGFANVWASTDMDVADQNAEASTGYGRRANFTAGLMPEITGGVITRPGDGYVYHTVTANDTLTVTTGGVVDILVVGGGGGGTSFQFGGAGGGGGGGVITQSGYTLGTGSYAITIGAGGAGAAIQTTATKPPRENGEDTTFGGLFTAVGGGAGGQSNFNGTATDGTLGGSGGGGQSETTGSAGGAGTVGQGNAGGAGSSSANNDDRNGGGGGGAGSAGADGTVSAGGDGGDGVEWPTSGSGDYYGGGGGGGAFGISNNAIGLGGLGGGGDGGRDNITAQSGTANTGGGGGGQSDNSGATDPGGDGGSGIVIVRYVENVVIVNEIPAAVSTSNGASIGTLTVEPNEVALLAVNVAGSATSGTVDGQLVPLTIGGTLGVTWTEVISTGWNSRRNVKMLRYANNTGSTQSGTVTLTFGAFTAGVYQEHAYAVDIATGLDVANPIGFSDDSVPAGNSLTAQTFLDQSTSFIYSIGVGELANDNLRFDSLSPETLLSSILTGTETRSTITGWQKVGEDNVVVAQDTSAGITTLSAHLNPAFTNTTFSTVVLGQDEGSGTNIGVTLAGPVEGDYLIVFASERSGLGNAALSVADNRSGVYDELGALDSEVADANARHSIKIWGRKVTATDEAGGNIVPTVTLSSSGTFAVTGIILRASTAYDWTHVETALATTGTGTTSPLSSGSVAAPGLSNAFFFGLASQRVGTDSPIADFTNLSSARFKSGVATNRITHAGDYSVAGQNNESLETTYSWDALGAETIVGLMSFTEGASGGPNVIVDSVTFGTLFLEILTNQNNGVANETISTTLDQVETNQKDTALSNIFDTTLDQVETNQKDATLSNIFDTTLDQVETNQKDAVAAISLSTQLQEAISNQLNTDLSLNFSLNLDYMPIGIIDAGGNVINESITFLASLAQIETNTLTANEAVILVTTLSEQYNVQLDKNEAIQFITQVAEQNTIQRIIPEDIIFGMELTEQAQNTAAKVVALTLAASLEQGTATQVNYNLVVNLATTLNQLASTGSQIFESLDFDITVNQEETSTRDLRESIEFAISQDEIIQIQLDATGEVTFSTELEQQQVNQLLGQANITIGQLAGLATIAGADIGVDIEFATIQNVVQNGFRVQFEIVTPGSRTLRVFVDDRLINLKDTRRTTKTFE